MTELGINWKGYIAANVSAGSTIDLFSRCVAYSLCHIKISARQDIASYVKELALKLDQASKYLYATDCLRACSKRSLIWCIVTAQHSDGWLNRSHIIAVGHNYNLLRRDN